jgi:hypothetical protein
MKRSNWLFYCVIVLALLAFNHYGLRIVARLPEVEASSISPAPLSAFLITNANGNSITNGATMWINSKAVTSTLNIAQYVIPHSGTLQNLWIVTTSTQAATGSLVCSVYMNGSVAGAISITIAANTAAGKFSDLVDQIAVAAGDLAAVGCLNNASTASADISSVSLGIH